MKVKSNKIRDIRDHYYNELKKTFPENEARRMLEIVFEDLLHITKTQWMLNPGLRISESELLKVHFACKELLKAKPVQYVVGKTHFYGMDLMLNANVLIPRPETEELVEWILAETGIDAKLSLLDIGTGSGAIALSLKNENPNFEIWACDVSPEALAVAAGNARLHQLEIKLVEADILNEKLWDEFPAFDIIVSNPPYVTETDKKLMQANVLNYEPHKALFVPDEDPLVFYRSILGFSKTHLKTGGKLFFEINENFGHEMTSLMEQFNFEDIYLKKDLNMRHRMISGIRKPAF